MKLQVYTLEQVEKEIADVKEWTEKRSKINSDLMEQSKEVLNGSIGNYIRMNGFYYKVKSFSIDSDSNVELTFTEKYDVKYNKVKKQMGTDKFNLKETRFHTDYIVPKEVFNIYTNKKSILNYGK